MYNAVYKCRLCGQIIDLPVKDWEAKNMSDRITGADGFTPEDNLRKIHRCENGNRGILDLQGFRFYGQRL